LLKCTGQQLLFAHVEGALESADKNPFRCDKTCISRKDLIAILKNPFRQPKISGVLFDCQIFDFSSEGPSGYMEIPRIIIL
jgi:hypothetical protein